MNLNWVTLQNHSCVYLNTTNKIGEIVKFTIYKNTYSIFCTNLININNNIDISLTLKNLFNEDNALSYVILDNKFRVVEMKSLITSATINYKELSNDCCYICCNSSTSNTQVIFDKELSNPNFCLDSGISYLDILNTSAIEANTSAIEVNTSAIEVNTSAIEVNTSAIEVNTSAETIDVSIDNLTSKVDTRGYFVCSKPIIGDNIKIKKNNM